MRFDGIVAAEDGDGVGGVAFFAIGYYCEFIQKAGERISEDNFFLSVSISIMGPTYR